MSDVTISKNLFSRVIDPQIDGYSAALFTTVTGSPAVASNKYRWNAASSRSNFQLLHGQVVIPLTIVTAPTAGHVRRFGFRGYGTASKGAAYFDITDDVLSAVVISDDGVTYSEQIAWLSAWTNTETNFKIAWDEKGVQFNVGVSSVFIPVDTTKGLTTPVYLTVENGVSDNMDASFILLSNIGKIVGIGSTISSITPGTGATNLGKAEDSAHTSGDVGVMALGVRNDNDSTLAGTDLDYAPIATTAAGRVKILGGFPEDFVHTSGDNGLFILAVRQDTPATTEADGDYSSLKVEGLKGLRVTQGSLISGESQARNRMLVVDGGTSTRITSAATTVCRNTTGRLNGVYVEVTLTGTATFYDNASAGSGTILWILPIGTAGAQWHEFRGATASNGVVCVTSAADRLVVNTDA